MKRHLRFFITVFLLLLFSALCLTNWRLYHSPGIRVIDGVAMNDDALCQLRYLRDAMENNAANKMQHLYPEGYVFFNALYGLSWCNLAGSLQHRSDLYVEAHAEVQRAFNNVNSQQGRVIFDHTLPLPYGAFYNGWLTYLLGKKLGMELPEKRDAAEVKLFKTQCAKIARAIGVQRYPESYYGSAWPADVVVCVAALAQHDRLYTSTYRPHINAWWRGVNQNLDPRGFIPHSADPGTGKPIEHARGSSQSLMQVFLPEIIPGDHGFDAYCRVFLGSRLGLPGIREYPKGKDGTGDIDSGPVILGMGGAATIVGMRAMRAHHRHSNSIALRNTVEALALPLKINGRKKYLFGKLPIADVFITWAQGPYTLAENAGTTGRYEEADKGWRIKFQIGSIVTCIAIAVLLVFMWRRKL
jgi:hypothetical protein